MTDALTGFSVVDNDIDILSEGVEATEQAIDRELLQIASND
jgi:hypothetical protein